MKTKRFLAFPLFCFLLGAVPGAARAQEDADGLRFLPDVVEQFQKLTDKADPLGFHIGGSPDPSNCRHLQAMARVDGPDGTPFFLVSRSGNQPKEVPGLICNDSD